MFPDLIGKIVNSMREEDYEQRNQNLWTWAIVIVIGALGTFMNHFLFGIVAERIGNSVRKRLFEKLITLDTAYYDETRTGDLLSRLTSDT